MFQCSVQVPRGWRLGALAAALPSLLLAAFAGAAPAAATPWGTSGADYTGVLCRLGNVEVPLGSWTVNGSVPAYSSADVAGSGAVVQPAPVTGTPTTMVAGQAGFTAADIAAVAYLIDRHGSGAPAERAEVSADIAVLAGSGGAQSRCLGQGGTSAARASARADEARRFAGPYSVTVAAPPTGVPGDQATVTVAVRSAVGVGTPGVDVQVTAGADVTSAVTGSDGLARAAITVPANAATTVTATIAQPTGLIYIDTSPPSIALGAAPAARGTTTLRPVLHPHPAVGVSSAELLLAEGELTPTAQVSGTSGYTGTGTIAVTGPVAAPSGQPCAAVPGARLAAAPAVWEGAFTFTGDGPQRAGATPGLVPGCYGVRASVTTTDSAPAETGTSALQVVTVSSLELSTAAAAKVVPAGALRATVTVGRAGRAQVSTTVVARGPVAIRDGGCDVDFTAAGTAGTSAAVTAVRAGSGLRATVAVPGVTRPGCYALAARSVVSLDGKTLVTTSPLGTDGSTTAVLRPTISVRAGAPSGEQGTAMAGTVSLSGTFGFRGVVSVGLVPGSTVPITGCADARFTAAPDTRVTRLATDGDDDYAVRTPVAARNACYALTARFTLTDNAAVTAGSGAPSASTVFLAGLRLKASGRSIVQTSTDHSSTRAIVAYAIFALLILVGCAVLFVRTVRDARDDGLLGSGTWRRTRPTHAPRRRPMPGPG